MREMRDGFEHFVGKRDRERPLGTPTSSDRERERETNKQSMDVCTG